jgi:ATP-dependent protease HslVU (ClpYQ) ATPase subunit
MGKMKEHSISFEQDARNLAEATMRLIQENRNLCAIICNSVSVKTMNDLEYAMSDAEGEAKNILAKTKGA